MCGPCIAPKAGSLKEYGTGFRMTVFIIMKGTLLVQINKVELLNSFQLYTNINIGTKANYLMLINETK